MTAHYARKDVKADGARAEIAGADQFQSQLFAEFLTKTKSIVCEGSPTRAPISSPEVSASAPPAGNRRCKRLRLVTR